MGMVMLILALITLLIVPVDTLQRRARPVIEAPSSFINFLTLSAIIFVICFLSILPPYAGMVVNHYSIALFEPFTIRNIDREIIKR